MSTSAIESRRRHAQKTATVYLLVAILTAFFGAVYERFSHEVYSYAMLYSFAFPLIGGALPFQFMALRPSGRYPGKVCRQMHHSGIATLTVGSAIKGVLDIYGTTNSLVDCYWLAGIGLIVAAVSLFYINVSPIWVER